MDKYTDKRKSILIAGRKLSGLIDSAGGAVAGSAALSQWKRTCDIIEQHLMDHIVRIAVVGAIKSGKSTLVNSLLHGDYLKRGAGVVTSIVTRIRRGERLRARLFFKTWNEINAEINQALVLFPAEHRRSQDRPFDIRSAVDRRDLVDSLSELDAELQISQDRLNANSVLLNSYLKGFDRVQSFIGEDNAVQDFEEAEFGRHRDFVGEDALAVFLKDIQIDVSSDRLPGNIELADCQGSDSPNPLHMAMIQDYLMKAHMIIYVISSRTGLRQADIRFLSTIKRMGIQQGMLFVFNCDFSEHESLVELLGLRDRLRQEIQIILGEPQVYTFSALYNLFEQNRAALPQKDCERLAQWRGYGRMVSFSGEESQRLDWTLDRRLTLEHSVLLLRNQLERLRVVSEELDQWVGLNRDLMRRDASEALGMAERLQKHRQHMVQVQSNIQSTLDGSLQKIKKELRRQTDSFFDTHSGTVVGGTLNFVRHYKPDISKYRQPLEESGFNRTLYLAFQEFKQALDRYMAEAVNPEIIGFIARQEQKLLGFMAEVAEPYAGIVEEAIGRYEKALSTFNLPPMPARDPSVDLPDLAALKDSIKLSVPPAAAVMRYSAGVRTEAVVHLGVYTLVRLVRKALKKPLNSGFAEELKALEIAIRRMKGETERSVIANFMDYRENLKFQVLLRLADAVSGYIYESLVSRFGAYSGDLVQLIRGIGSEKSGRERTESALSAVAENNSIVKAEIETLRNDVIHLAEESYLHANNVRSIP